MLSQGLRRRYDVKFQTATTLMESNTRVASLDKLMRSIPRNSIIFLKGSPRRKYVLELSCLRFIFQHKGYCAYIDGSNSFDPYLLSRLAVMLDANPKKILDKIMIARAFTCYQLVSLVTEETERIVSNYRSSFIAVSDLLHLFTDPESEVYNSEARMIIPVILASLRKLANYGTMVMVTSDANNEYLVRMIESYSDITLTVYEEKELIHMILNKHPRLKDTYTELTLNDITFGTKCTEDPITMEPWLTADG